MGYHGNSFSNIDRSPFSLCCFMHYSIFISSSFHYLLHLHCQVDLFFYREPEEAKDQQEEEVPAIQDYPDYGAAAIGGGEWTSSQIPDVQWTAEPVPAAPVAGGWAGEEGECIHLLFKFFYCNLVFCPYLLESNADRFLNLF